MMAGRSGPRALGMPDGRFPGRLVAIVENSWPRVCDSCRNRVAASCSTCGRRGAASALPEVLAHARQEQGLDTVEANLALGLPEDMRDYRVAAEMLLDLGVRRARLLTNNPAKIEGLERYGVEVEVVRIPLGISPNPRISGICEPRGEDGPPLPMTVPLEVACEGSA